MERISPKEFVIMMNQRYPNIFGQLKIHLSTNSFKVLYIKEIIGYRRAMPPLAELGKRKVLMEMYEHIVANEEILILWRLL